MDELFLQELNAITNYANSSNTDKTEKVVREMLEQLLNMKYTELYGNRCRPFEEGVNESE